MNARTKRIFIGSTAYDLIDIRAELVRFLKECGQEPINFEAPHFTIQTEMHAHDACIESIRNSDIYLLIINERYGGEYRGLKYPEYKMHNGIPMSVTWAETAFAYKHGIPVHPFVRQEVWAERPIYKKSKSEGIKYDPFHAKDNRVFEFIDFIVHQQTNNWVETFKDIVDLKEKIAGKLQIFEKPKTLSANEYLSNLIAKCRRDDFLDLSPSKVSAEDIFIPLSLSEDTTIVAQFDSQNEKVNQAHRETNPRNLDADDFLNYLIEHQESAVILGIPGSGKTKLLRHWCSNLATRAYSDPSIPLPLLISALQLTRAINARHEGGDMGLVQILTNSLDVSMELSEEIFSRLKSGKAIILIDGLDEVPEGNIQTIGREGLEAWLVEDIMENPNLKLRTVVVTCRKANYLRPLKFKNHFLINEFNRPQIEQFTELWLGKELYRKFMDQFQENTAIQRLSENPLLLKLVCLVCSRYPQETLPLKRVEVCKKAVKMLLEEWETHHRIPTRNQVDTAVKIQILEDIALKMIEESQRELPSDRVYEIIHTTKPSWCGIEPRVIKMEIVNSGLIIPLQEERYSFVLPTFLEFFAANGLHRQKDWVEQVSKLAQNNIWHGAFSFLAQNNKDAEHLLDALLKTDPILAYDSTKEWKLNEPTQQRLMRALIQSLHSFEKHRQWAASEIIMKKLEVTPSSNEMAVIYENLPDSPYFFLEWWADKLVHAGDDIARGAFVQSLETKGSFRKQISLRKLGKGLGKPVKEKIRQMINSPEPPEQWEAIHALGKLSDSDSLDLLRDIVKDHLRHRLVRAEAIRVLGCLGDKKDLSLLEEISKENEWILTYFCKISIQQISHRYGLPQVIRNEKLKEKHNLKDILTTVVSPNWDFSGVHYGNNPRWILHVVESNYDDWDNKWNEVEFLHYAIAELGIKCFCVEGGSGNVDLLFLRTYAPLSGRIEVALEYFKVGKISSEEYLQIATDYEFHLRGIEDEAAYQLAAEKLCRGDLSGIDSEKRLEATIKNVLSILSEENTNHVLLITVTSSIFGTGASSLAHRIKEQGLCYARVTPKFSKHPWQMPQGQERIWRSVSDKKRVL